MTPSTLREYRRLLGASIRRAVAGDDTGAARDLAEAALCLSAAAIAAGAADDGERARVVETLTAGRRELHRRAAAQLVERRDLLDRCRDMGAAWSPGELAMVLSCGEAEAAAIIASGWPVPRG